MREFPGAVAVGMTRTVQRTYGRGVIVEKALSINFNERPSSGYLIGSDYSDGATKSSWDPNLGAVGPRYIQAEDGELFRG